MSEQIYTVLLQVTGFVAGTVIMYILGQRKVNERDEQIEELEGTVKTRDKKIKSLNKSLKKRGATLETLNTDLSQRDTTIQSLEEQVRKRDEYIEAANADIEELRRQNQELLKLTQEREQEITTLKAKERAMQDDFSHLDGVGPKISATLRAAGIKTFAKLAAKDVEDLREILVAENPRLLRLSDPTTWPEQAGMAAEGRWEDLKALQEGFKERRRRERLSLQQSQEIETSPEIETTTVVTDA